MQHATHPASPAAPSALAVPRIVGALDTTLDGIKPFAPTVTVEMITTPQGLASLGERLQGARIIGLDTETGGNAALNEPLNAHLALVQCAIPRGDDSYDVFVVDVWALARADATNPDLLAPLRSCLEDPSIPKVIHHSQFERIQFERWGISLDGVVDTERLARDSFSELPSYSLRACFRELLNQDLQKDQQTSDWLRRPLSTEQVRYAAHDPVANLELHSYLAKITAPHSPSPLLTAAAKPDHLSSALAETELACAHLRAPFAPTLSRLQYLQQELLQLAKEVVQEAAIGAKDDYRVNTPWGTVTSTFTTAAKPDEALIKELHPEFWHAQQPAYVSKSACEKHAKAQGMSRKDIQELVAVCGSELPLRRSVTIQTHPERLLCGNELETLATLGITSPTYDRARELMAGHADYGKADALRWGLLRISGVELPLVAEGAAIGRNSAVDAPNEEIVQSWIGEQNTLRETAQMLCDALRPRADCTHEERTAAIDAILHTVVAMRDEGQGVLRRSGIQGSLAHEATHGEQLRQHLDEYYRSNGSPGTTIHPLATIQVKESTPVIITHAALAARHPQLAATLEQEGGFSFHATKERFTEYLDQKGIPAIARDGIVSAVFTPTRSENRTTRTYPRYSAIYETESVH